MSLPTGSIVYEENTFVSCLEYSKKENYCDCCFKKRARLVKCIDCQFMQYCSRNCEKNDIFCHKFECDKFKKFIKNQSLKDCFNDTLLRLFLRILIKLKNAANFEREIERFKCSIDKYNYLILDDERMHQINHFKQIIIDLMGFEFLEKFETNDLISNFGRMLLNKVEISNNNEIIGLGVFLDLSKFPHSCKPNSKKIFDSKKLIIKTTENLDSKNQVNISFCDPQMSYCERTIYLKQNYYLCDCNCVKCCAEKMFPALKFSEKVTSNENLKLAIKIAEKFLSSQTVRTTFGEIFAVDPKISLEKMSRVELIFKEMEDCLGYTTREASSKLIFINIKFEKRLKLLKKQTKCEESQKELEIITVCIGLVIIHEVAHLLFRWKGLIKTPTNLKEAGEVLEKKIFYGTVHTLIGSENWNENSSYVGELKYNEFLFFRFRSLGIGIKTSEWEKFKYLSQEYISRIYNLSLLDAPNGFVLPIFDEFSEVRYKRALKTSDEFVESQIISRHYGLPPGVYIVNRTCGT